MTQSNNASTKVKQRPEGKRPKVYLKFVGVSMTAAQEAKLRQVAVDNQTSASWVIRQLIEAVLNDDLVVYQRMRKLCIGHSGRGATTR